MPEASSITLRRSSPARASHTVQFDGFSSSWWCCLRPRGFYGGIVRISVSSRPSLIDVAIEAKYDVMPDYPKHRDVLGLLWSHKYHSEVSVRLRHRLRSAVFARLARRTAHSTGYVRRRRVPAGRRAFYAIPHGHPFENPFRASLVSQLAARAIPDPRGMVRSATDRRSCCSITMAQPARHGEHGRKI